MAAAFFLQRVTDHRNHGRDQRGTAEGAGEVSKKQRGEGVLVERIEPCILLVRGQRVMLDADLAELYGATTKAFNQAVKRNLERFPADFMFQLTAEEAEAIRSQTLTADLRSQIVTASSCPLPCGHKL